ncbi:unnamed protein product [Lampetra planeri]
MGDGAAKKRKTAIQLARTGRKDREKWRDRRKEKSVKATVALPAEPLKTGPPFIPIWLGAAYVLLLKFGHVRADKAKMRSTFLYPCLKPLPPRLARSCLPNTRLSLPPSPSSSSPPQARDKNARRRSGLDAARLTAAAHEEWEQWGE